MASHAAAMYPLLNERRLYHYTGGEPPGSEADVEAWFSALESRQSPDGLEHWLTWIVHQQDSAVAVGYVQATVSGADADIAWLLGVGWQGQGFAREASSALVSWLLDNGVAAITAHVHPDHLASQGVARAAGLAFTGSIVDGEQVWALGRQR